MREEKERERAKPELGGSIFLKRTNTQIINQLFSAPSKLSYYNKFLLLFDKLFINKLQIFRHL